MKNISKLKEILNIEGITNAELSRASKVNSMTIGKLCKGDGDRVRETTKGKIIKGLNSIVGHEKYSFSNVFS